MLRIYIRRFVTVDFLGDVALGDCKPIKALHEKSFTTPNTKQKALTNVRAFFCLDFSLFCAKHAFFADTWWVFEGLQSILAVHFIRPLVGLFANVVVGIVF